MIEVIRKAKAAIKRTQARLNFSRYEDLVAWQNAQAILLNTALKNVSARKEIR